MASVIFSNEFGELGRIDGIPNDRSAIKQQIIQALEYGAFSVFGDDQDSITVTRPSNPKG